VLVVMDADSGKVLSSVPIAKGVDQIAFDPSNQRIYCAAGGAGVVTVLHETETGVESLGDVKTATGAHTVTVDPKTHSVWVAYTERESGKSYVLRLEAK
jgi:DNA-binding beta-propeller fold protein YncE